MKKQLSALAVGVQMMAVGAFAQDGALVKTVKPLLQPVFGSSMGDPVEVRSVGYYSNIILEGSKKDLIDLASIPRLSLKSGQQVKRVEVRAAGEGEIAISINGSRASQTISISDKFEFQTYSLKIDTANQVISAQSVPQVKVEVLSGEVRIMDIDVVLLKPITPPASAAAVGSVAKSTCDVYPAQTSHAWVLQIGNRVARYSSPEDLFKAVQNQCLPMRFLCNVAEMGYGGMFVIAVRLHGETQNATGSLGLKDATQRLEQLQKSGLCAY